MNNRIHPLVRLPQKADRIIYLLREELKAAWFFNHMNIIGLSDPYREPSLCTGILLFGRDYTCEVSNSQFLTNRTLNR